MKKSTIIPLFLALVLGLFAAVGARKMLSRPAESATPQSEFVEVVVAKDNLVAGTILTLDDLTTGKVDNTFDVSNTFRDLSELEGRVVQAPVFKGLPILSSQLAAKGSGGGLQSLLPGGMRAITVEVNEFSGVGGFLLPGCHVDVIATVPDENGDLISRTIVHRVKVSAVGQRLTLVREDEERERSRSVTLIATLKEAEAIELASSMGLPRLVLRNTSDDVADESHGVTLADLRGKASMVGSDPFGPVPVMLNVPAPVIPTPSAAEQPAPQVRVIKVIRGGSESEATFTQPMPEQTPSSAPAPVVPRRGDRVTAIE
jgi:pilus assembly protein CpaB